jgi:SUN domain-containing protein 1/2
MADNREKRRSHCILHAILNLIAVVSVVAGIMYVCVQLVSLFMYVTRDTGMEVEVLRQEVEALKAELSTELRYLREDFLGDLSYLLQREDTGVSNSPELLSILNDTSKKIVKEPTEFYDTIKTGQIDFALESLGGSVVSTRDTEEVDSSRSVQHIIQACVLPGECWAFKGSGVAVIQLIGKVNIKAVSIEHASRALWPKGLINSAPKDFSVWGLDSLHDEGHYFGEFTYNIDGSPLQYFPIQEPSEKPFHLIELRIHTNHGNPIYTCLYRFRVHGSMGHDGQAQTSSN